MAAVGAAAVLLTGCGGGSGGNAAQSPSPSASDARAAMLAVSQCMRANGYPNFPDPVQDSQGRWGFPDSVPRRTNATRCDALVRRAKSLNRGKDQERVSAADMGKLRQYSACMRQQGVTDWPDPTPTGAFKLPSRLEGPSGRRLIEAQDRACSKYAPPSGIRVEHAGSGRK